MAQDRDTLMTDPRPTKEQCIAEAGQVLAYALAQLRAETADDAAQPLSSLGHEAGEPIAPLD